MPYYQGAVRTANCIAGDLKDQSVSHQEISLCSWVKLYFFCNLGRNVADGKVPIPSETPWENGMTMIYRERSVDLWHR